MSNWSGMILILLTFWANRLFFVCRFGFGLGVGCHRTWHKSAKSEAENSLSLLNANVDQCLQCPHRPRKCHQTEMTSATQSRQTPVYLTRQSRRALPSILNWCCKHGCALRTEVRAKRHWRGMTWIQDAPGCLSYAARSGSWRGLPSTSETTCSTSWHGDCNRNSAPKWDEAVFWVEGLHQKWEFGIPVFFR